MTEDTKCRVDAGNTESVRVLRCCTERGSGQIVGFGVDLLTKRVYVV